MDHIPNVTPVVYEHPRVPYIRPAEYEYKYGSGQWVNFPYRCGWYDPNFLKIEFSLSNSEHDRRFSSFLQNWFYFGLLAETLGIPINVADFVDGNDDNQTITTRRLPEFIDQWSSRVHRLSQSEKAECAKNLDNFLREWYWIYHECVGYNESNQKISSEIHLSIAILHTTLVMAKRVIFPMSDMDHIGFESPLVKNRMMKDGWCESDLRKLEQSGVTSVLGFYYCSLLGPRQVLRDHGQCNYRNCLAFQIKNEEYVTRHVTTECNCENVRVDIDKLYSILKKNIVPVLTFEDNGFPHDASIELHESNINTSYVAISHVWADGLGNPHENSLPRCQLRRLQMYANRALSNPRTAKHTEVKNIPFWIDTICVPVNDDDEYQGMAIQLMVDTYEKAKTHSF